MQNYSDKEKKIELKTPVKCGIESQFYFIVC